MANIKKGDTVIVLNGNDKGKKGKVLAVDPKASKVLVEGVNVRTRHMKAKKQGQESGIIKKEATIHMAKVNVFCAKCSKGVRTGIKVLADNTKVRICKKCSEEIKTAKASK